MASCSHGKAEIDSEMAEEKGIVNKCNELSKNISTSNKSLNLFVLRNLTFSKLLCFLPESDHEMKHISCKIKIITIIINHLYSY